MNDVVFSWRQLLTMILSIGVLVGILYYVVCLMLRKNRHEVNEKKFIATEKVSEEKSVYAKIKEERNKNNMTQEFVAEQLGVSRQAVSKWESGTAFPSTSKLKALAELYHVSVDQLLGNRDQG